MKGDKLLSKFIYMAININLNGIGMKLSLSIFMVVIFYLLYLTIPDSEFDNVSNQSCKIDRLYYAVTNHIGVRENDTLKPITNRSKMLTMAQIILSYSILLL